MEKLIEEYFSQFSFDVREHGDARFCDQKCTPDIVSTIAEIILNYVGTDSEKTFTKNDIWKNDFSDELFRECYGKPSVYDKKLESEYDKVFGQPLRMLFHSKVLNSEKKGNTYHYSILRMDILEYISLRERNALNFLYAFLTKTISDSGLKTPFDKFFIEQSKEALHTLCQTLDDFYHKYTGVTKNDEPPRIYNKFIDILAFKNKKKGVVKGFLSKGTITIDEIRYNRINWRDINKDKSISRQEYKELFNESIGNNSSYYKYAITKAKHFVKTLHPYSEIHRFKEYPGIQAHHIFMESEFPEIADYPENIICLTPNQHYFRAHPNNHTYTLDKDYQLVCLLCKLDSIEINYREGKEDYSLQDFIQVLNVGFDTNIFTSNMDFEEVKYQILKNAYYQN